MLLLQLGKKSLESAASGVPSKKRFYQPEKPGKPLRVNVGWKHKVDKVNSIIVPKKDGGGRRFVRLPPSSSLSTLQTETVKIFMNTKKARKIKPVDLVECEYSIETSDGLDISEFTDLDDNPCDLQTYLSVRGMYASKTKFFLVTTACTTNDKGVKSAHDSLSCGSKATLVIELLRQSPMASNFEQAQHDLELMKSDLPKRSSKTSYTWQL